MSSLTWRGCDSLFQCVFRGDIKEFTQIFSPELVNLIDEQKRSPLHVTSHYGEISMVHMLIWAGARVNAKDSRWLTPLHRACSSGYAEVVKVLLDHGADRNARDKTWQTPLHVASSNGHLECVRLLLSTLGESCTSAAGLTPPQNPKQVAKLLLENGASVNAFDKFDRRSMHWAAFSGNVDIIELLHRFGAEVTCRDKDHYTPLHVAAAMGHRAVATCLIQHGADLTACTARGNTPLHVACLNGQAGVTLVLLSAIAGSDKTTTLPSNRDQSKEERGFSDTEREHGAGGQTSPQLAVSSVIDQISEVDEFSPLHLAVVSTHGANCLKLLLDTMNEKKLGDSDQPCLAGKIGIHKAGGEYNSFPLHLAALHGRCDRAKLLLCHGAEVNARDRLGNTALHIAADRGHEPLVALLLQANGGDAGVWLLRGQAGSNPLHRAAMSGFAGCLSRLIKASLLNLQLPTESVDNAESRRFTQILGDLDLESEEFADVLSSSSPLSRSLQRRLLDLFTESSDDDGCQLLHAAALGANLDCLRLVLLLIAAVSSDNLLGLLHRDSLGRSVLHYAVASCGTHAQHLLLSNDDSHSQRFVNNTLVDSATNVILLLMKLGADVNAADHFGCTPLHLACAFDHTGNLVKLLLDHGANPLAITSHWPPVKTSMRAQRQPSVADVDDEESGNRLRCLPIHVAVRVGNLSATARLLESVTLVESPETLASYCYGGLLGTCTQDHKRCLHEPDESTTTSPCLLASLRGYEDILKLLLDALVPSAYGRQPLSGTKPSTESARMDVAWGRHRDYQLCRLSDGAGHTALHLAAHTGHTRVCHLLLEHDTRYGNGQLLTRVDSVYQWTALHHASAQGHCDVVHMLLQHADVHHGDGVWRTDLRNMVDEHGRTAIMLAAQYNHTSVLLQLLTGQADGETRAPFVDLDAADVYGRTALHRAVANGHFECTQILLQYGADADKVDFRKRHALHMAAASGQISTLTLLLDHLSAAYPNVAIGSAEGHRLLAPLDQSAFSPLHFAAYRGNTECLSRLLTLPPYQTLMKSNAYTPLHCAVQNGHLDCLSLLLNQFGEDYLTTRDANDRTVIHVAALSNQAGCLSAIVQCYQEQFLRTDAETGVPFPLSTTTPNLQLAAFLGQPDGLGRTGLMLAAGAGWDACFTRLLELHRQLLPQIVQDDSTANAPSDTTNHLSLTVQDHHGKTVLHHACSASAREQADSTALLVVDSLTKCVSCVVDTSPLFPRHLWSLLSVAAGSYLPRLSNLSVDIPSAEIGTGSSELASIIDLRDSAGRTLLHVATIAGLPRIVEVLLAADADVDAVDNEGCIPALSSAPSNTVAACLSLIMAAMFPPPKRLSNSNTANETPLERKHSKFTEDSGGPAKRTSMTAVRRNSYPGAWPASSVGRPSATDGVHCWSGKLTLSDCIAVSQCDVRGTGDEVMTQVPVAAEDSPPPSEADFY